MREARIKDTLSGELRALEPGSDVGIYACGPTVYSRIHIGNARPFVIFSLFSRFLHTEGYRPKLVVNVTDINDKIYVAAREAGKGSVEFAAEMTAAYFEDTDRLGLGRPDSEPLASETVDGIVSLIAELVEGGHAYESGGDVYFRVRSFDAYGKLSNRRPEDMDQGEDAGSASLKEDRLDFALWVRGGRSSVRPGLDAQRDDRDRRGEDVEIGRQYLPALGGARRLRARGCGRVSDLWALSAAAGFRRGADGGICCQGRAPEELLSREPSRRSRWTELSARSIQGRTRRRLQHAESARRGI
jgi:hypothetical protein